MSRPDIESPQLTEVAQAAMAAFHPDVVAEVQAAVKEQDVVVVGMGWNPHCKRARRILDEAGITHTYLEYGNYSSKWSARLALKMWSGWPTFPQVYVKGALLGGADQAQKALSDGTFQALLDPKGE